MTGFEAAESVQPQDDASYEKLRKKPNNFTWAVTILFFVVAFLCVNNIILINSYQKIKSDLLSSYEVINDQRQEKVKLASTDSALYEELQKLSDENRKLKEENRKASRGSSDLNEQLELMKKKNNELSIQNRNLVDDNIALQNSLKMAASAGVKPQNYTEFEGLNARTTINRGEYIGKFLGTAYTPSKEECGNDMGLTRSGKAIMPGVTIAVDGRYWPFGTVFYVKGLGYTVAMDTGSAIKGKYRFDFSVFDKGFAKLLGARKWEVYLVKLGNGNVNNIKL